MVDAIERRRHERTIVQAPSRLVHEPSGRVFPCQCRDVSIAGAKVAAPAVMPVRAGHTVSLRAGEALRGLVATDADEDVPATVVRVDREAMFTDGSILIALEFDPA